MGRIELEPFALTVDEIAAYSAHIGRRRLVAFCAFMWLAFAALTFRLFPGQFAVYLGLPSLAVAIGILMGNRRMRRLIMHPANRIALEERSVVLDGESLHIKTASGIESSVPLKSFIKLELYRGLYVLYVSKTGAIVLPKRAFKSQQDQTDAVHQFAAANVPILMNQEMMPVAVARPTLPAGEPPSQD